MSKTIRVRIRNRRVIEPAELPAEVEGWLTIQERREEGPMEQIKVLDEVLDEQELARRAALLDKILEARTRRVIAPLTAADLIHEVREEEAASYGQKTD